MEKWIYKCEGCSRDLQADTVYLSDGNLCINCPGCHTKFVITANVKCSICSAGKPAVKLVNRNTEKIVSGVSADGQGRNVELWQNLLYCRDCADLVWHKCRYCGKEHEYKYWNAEIKKGTFSVTCPSCGMKEISGENLKCKRKISKKKKCGKPATRFIYINFPPGTYEKISSIDQHYRFFCNKCYRKEKTGNFLSNVLGMAAGLAVLGAAVYGIYLLLHKGFGLF